MKVLFDTSVLVAGMVAPHPMHAKAVSWIRRAKAGEITMFVSCHTLAELYAVLTTLPVSPRISPDMAWRLIHENLEKTANVVPLGPKDYADTLRQMKDSGFSGGIVYDALIFKAALKAGVETLLTLNAADFSRMQSGTVPWVIEP